MITFPGYDEVINNIYNNNQDQVFSYWNELNNDEKKSLLDDLKDIDFEQLHMLFNSVEKAEASDYSPAPYIPLPKTMDEMNTYEEAKTIGISKIKDGKLAAFLVAGGQGSRLGFDGPKGKFPVGPVTNKTLFQIHGEKILKYSKKYDTSIPWLIMTSHANHVETVSYFKENNFFGINKEDVMIFPQNMIPSLDSQGNLILQNKNSIFKNPDGHGGSLTALYTSGSLEKLKERGIEIISYFQVDNPLVKILDPVFIGFHVKNQADISSKALKKAYAGEKVGVFVQFNDKKFGVMEYSDLPDEKANATDEQGNLLYSSGSIAIHLFNRTFIEIVTAKNDISLPFHTAKKKIKAFKNGSIEEIDGFKYEKFVFDALPLTERNIIFETLREEEFAPVKNAAGVDSVETSQELMMNLHRKWLSDRNIALKDSVKKVEISPLLAVEPEDIPEDIEVSAEENLQIQ